MLNLFKTPAERDIELLSAYLDDALSPHARQALEMRLQREADLARQLDEMRRTQSLVRSLPKVKAPRNYTLTPQQAAAIRRAPGGTPVADLWLRTATAVVAVMFVVVLAGQNIAGNVALPAAQAPVFESAPELSSGPAAGDMEAEPTALAEEAIGIMLATESPEQPAEEESIGITMVTEIAPAATAEPEGVGGAVSTDMLPTEDGSRIVLTEDPNNKLSETPTALPTPTAFDSTLVPPPQPATAPSVPWATLGLGLLLAGLLGVTVWRWWQNRR